MRALAQAVRCKKLTGPSERTCPCYGPSQCVVVGFENHPKVKAAKERNERLLLSKSEDGR